MMKENKENEPKSYSFERHKRRSSNSPKLNFCSSSSKTKSNPRENDDTTQAKKETRKLEKMRIYTNSLS